MKVYFILIYSTPFELHDDAYVLKAMRLHNSPSNSHEGGNGILKPELTDDEKLSTIHSLGMHHTSPSKNSPSHHYQSLPTKALNSHPLPAILKARVKQEYIN